MIRVKPDVLKKSKTAAKKFLLAVLVSFSWKKTDSTTDLWA
jgi:hypothetical protein